MPTPDTKSPNKGRIKLGLEFEANARDILAYVKGEKTFPIRRTVLPDEVDVKRIRTASGMTQIDFARAFHIELRTLQD